MMRKNIHIKIFIIIIFNLSLFLNKVYALENKILFKVDNKIITSVDILKESKYLKIINHKLLNIKNKEIFEISKKSLIREKIKEIELLRYFDELKIEDEYLNKLIVNYFSNKININTINEFEKFFINEKINPDIIKKKIMIEILWNQLIYNKFNKRVKIDKNLIKKELSNLNKKTEYLLSEIVFNLKKEEKLDKKYEIIKKNIENKDFSQVASIYSISDHLIQVVN